MAHQSLFRRTERYAIGKMMGLVAWIIERRVVKLKRGAMSPPPASPPKVFHDRAGNVSEAD